MAVAMSPRYASGPARLESWSRLYMEYTESLPHYAEKPGSWGLNPTLIHHSVWSSISSQGPTFSRDLEALGLVTLVQSGRLQSNHKVGTQLVSGVSQGRMAADRKG